LGEEINRIDYKGIKRAEAGKLRALGIPGKQGTAAGLLEIAEI
jgi:hypothetical protein